LDDSLHDPHDLYVFYSLYIKKKSLARSVRTHTGHAAHTGKLALGLASGATARDGFAQKFHSQKKVTCARSLKSACVAQRFATQIATGQ
jgi:hypothetical protein